MLSRNYERMMKVLRNKLYANNGYNFNIPVVKGETISCEMLVYANGKEYTVSVAYYDHEVSILVNGNYYTALDITLIENQKVLAIRTARMLRLAMGEINMGTFDVIENGAESTTTEATTEATESTETTESTESTETTEMASIENVKTIKDWLQEEGLRAFFIDTDGTLYFQYDRTYRAITETTVERIDHRVEIVAFDVGVEVLFKADGGGWWEWQHREFKTLTEALKWIEREVK